jgi:starvation-inducible DNA-binding protein
MKKQTPRKSTPSARSVTSTRQASVTVPTLTSAEGAQLAEILQLRLVGLLDLGLTLKHIHWNVVGPNFISVHQMLDPQYVGVQEMVDETAERIATLGGVPSGLPGKLVSQRVWDDYELGRADSLSHLGALDLVYQGVILDHRQAIEDVSEVDAMSEDMLVGQTRQLELYHWFIRSHLSDWAGGMANAGATSELEAAQSVANKRSKPSGTSRSSKQA